MLLFPLPRLQIGIVAIRHFHEIDVLHMRVSLETGGRAQDQTRTLFRP